MATLFGRNYTRAEIAARVGRLEQVVGVESSTLNDGLAAGVRALRVETGGGLSFTVLPDRCLDIAHLSWNGQPLCWLNAPGIVAPAFYEPEGSGFLRSFFGGLLTTCGLRNFGPPCTVDGEDFPMHGRVGNLPASAVAWGADWQGDDCTFWIEGTVRESRLFGENLALHRRITTELGGSGLRITTTVRNEGDRPEGHMILFHMNLGWPLLDDGARLEIEPLSVIPRDADAMAGLADHDRFTGPRSGFKEEVFTLDLKPDDAGMARATLWNDNLSGGLGLRLSMRKDELPCMFEWRQLGVGAYVLGLEPANCPTIMGRADAAKEGTLPILAPGEERQYQIDVDIVRPMS